MIVAPRPRAYQLLFLLRGSILPQIVGKVLFIAAIATFATWWHGNLPHYLPEFSVAPLTLMGLALSIFLGFRNNACYERWWEGRRQWGALISEMRVFSRDVLSLLPANARDSRGRPLILGVMAFAHALAAQLRGVDPVAPCKPYVEEGGLNLPEGGGNEGGCNNYAEMLLRQVSEGLVACRDQGLISDYLLGTLLERLRVMTGIQAACERIRNTPLPYAYTLLLHRTAYLFCLLLPLGIIGTLDWLTPLFAAIVAYTFFGLDALGDELEEPFGTTSNALPLNAMARTIEINLREALGDSLPEPLKPDRDLLL